ncbi:MAG: hypothetical protein ACKVU1_04335 [bacterium]
MRAFARTLALVMALLLVSGVTGSTISNATPPAPPAPAGSRTDSSGKVIEVTIDDDGIQVGGMSVTSSDDSAGDDPGHFSGKITISDDGDTIIVHKSGAFRVESSTADVVRMGSDITVAPDETVQGDVVAIGGSIDVLGQVMGDVVAIGGMLHLASTARVNGDAVSIGGSVDKDAGAEVNGETVSIGIPLPAIGPLSHSSGDHGPRASAVVSKFFVLAVMAFFIFLAVSFARDKVRAMANVIPERPWRLLFVGILVWILFVPACILLVISIIGILFLPVFIVLVFGGVIVGLVAVYQLVGERFRGGAYSGRPFASAFLGLVVVHSFSILGTILGAIAPWLTPLPGALSVFGTMLAFFAATVGVGCVLHTRFGTRNVSPPAAFGGGASAGGAPADWGWTPPPVVTPGTGVSAGAGDRPVPPPPEIPRG